MGLPIINISSDSDSDSSSCSSCSSSSDDDVRKANISNSRINGNHTDSSKNQRSYSKNVQTKDSCHNNQPEAMADPLFKIIFRDKLTSRKYRRRIEDIIKYAMVSQLDDDNHDEFTSDLVLEIYDPIVRKESSSQTPTPEVLTIPSNSTSYNKHELQDNSDLSNSRKICNRKKHRSQSSSTTEDILELPSNTSYVKHKLQDNTDFSNSEMTCNTRKKHIPQTLCITEEILEIPSNNISYIKHKLPSTTDYSNSEKVCRKSPTPLTLCMEEEVSENSSNNTNCIKQELQDSTDSFKSEKIRKTKMSPQKTLDLTEQVPAMPSNSTINIKHELQNNTSSSNSEKICNTKYIIIQNEESIPQTPLTEEATDSSNSKKKSKHKRELRGDDDSSHCKKKSKNCSEKNDDELSTNIYNDILDNRYSQMSNLEIGFENNAVLIGSYGYFNQNKSIFISKDGLTFFVPTFKNEKQLIILNIELNEILRVLVHFSKTKPALFFFVAAKTAKGIKDHLGMDDPNRPYFDPDSKDPKHQLITILPAEMNNESEVIIKELFKNTEMVKIDAQTVRNLIYTVAEIKNTHDKQINTTTPKNAYKKFKESLKNCNKTNNAKPVKETDTYNMSSCDKFMTYYCRIVRVGSLEYAKNRVFGISRNGLKFCIPQLNNGSNVTLHIDIHDIVNVAIHFSNVLPILFVYISAKAAEMIRQMIGMNDPSGPYIDPNSDDETCNKIIILPQQISERNKVIKKWYNRGKINRLDEETARDILAKSFSSVREKSSEMTLYTGNPFEKKHKRKQDTTESLENNNMTTTWKNNQKTTEAIPNLCVCVMATCVRIGTFKYYQEELNIMISTKGLNINIPVVHDCRTFKNVIVEFNEITEVSYLFALHSSYLFFYTTAPCAQRVRSLLQMPDKTNASVYFDPNAESLAERRLVIIYKSFSHAHQSILKTVFSQVQSKCIPNLKTVNSMLRNKM